MFKKSFKIIKPDAKSCGCAIYTMLTTVLKVVKKYTKQGELRGISVGFMRGDIKSPGSV